MFGTAAGGEIKPLTGLRGLAALMVVGHHAEAGMLTDRTHVFMRGQIWVDLFFIMSGFVMGYVYLQSQKIDFRSFYIARFSRIYPLHIVTGLGMLALVMAGSIALHRPFPPQVSWVEAVREFTLTMALPIIGTVRVWNDPAWSISIEWWVYFTMFPLIAIFGYRIPARWLAVGVGTVLIALVVVLMQLPVDFRVTRGWVALARGEVGFVAGYAIFRVAVQYGAVVVPRGWIVDSVAMAAFIAIYLLPQLTGYHEAWAVLLVFPVIILGCLGQSSLTSRFLSTRVMVWLGKISYSIYLCHLFIIVTWEFVAAKLHLESAPLAIAVAYTLILPLAWASFHIVEAPARSGLRRMFGAVRKRNGTGAPVRP